MFCNQTKEFLSQNGIEFQERDVSQEEAALEELQKRGLMTTPVTLIDDDVVVGFDRAKLGRLLGIEQAASEPSPKQARTRSALDATDSSRRPGKNFEKCS